MVWLPASRVTTSTHLSTLPSHSLTLPVLPGALVASEPGSPAPLCQHLFHPSLGDSLTVTALRNKWPFPLVNHVKCHSQGQLVRTQATTFLQGEDIDYTKCLQSCARLVPSPPAQHILTSLHGPLRLGLQASWAHAPPPALEKTMSPFWMVTWA